MEAKKKRGKQIADPELAAYAKSIGSKQYKKEYITLYTQARTKTKTHSGKPGNKSKEELEAIKRKYQNGVTREHINEMVGL